MLNSLSTALEFEHKVLIFLFIISYLGAMAIQIRDPKTRVEVFDWFVGFLTSMVGGIITFFICIGWDNIGLRMGVTIIATLVSYRTFKFILSEDAQNDFAKGFWKGIITSIQRLLNSDPKSTNNNHNPNT